MASELRRHRPGAALFSWNLPDQPGPVSLDDITARSDWGWQSRYDLLGLVRYLLLKPAT